MLKKLGSLTCGVLFAVGCGSSETSSTSSESAGTVRLQATVANRTLDNARVVAIASDGMKHWAYLDARGRFTLNLPSNKSYRVLLLNSVRNAPARVAGHVVIQTSAGAQRWIGLDGSSSVINLGILSNVATTGNGVATKSDRSSSDADDDGSDGSDDHSGDTHDCDRDDEHAKACTDRDGKDDKDDVSDDDAVELHPSNDPGDRCKDEHERDHEDSDGKDKDDDDSDRACTPASGDGGAGPTPPPPPGTPAPPPAPPSSAGGACAVNADCVTGLACVASVCSAVIN